jgi:multidrug efflux pump subunit AcrA (membrane-fusion protein)
VYVVDDHEGLHYRQVRIGRRYGDKEVVILAGLTAGERVALDPIKAVVRYKEQRAGISQ